MGSHKFHWRNKPGPHSHLRPMFNFSANPPSLSPPNPLHSTIWPKSKPHLNWIICIFSILRCVSMRNSILGFSRRMSLDKARTTRGFPNPLHFHLRSFIEVGGVGFPTPSLVQVFFVPLVSHFHFYSFLQFHSLLGYLQWSSRRLTVFFHLPPPRALFELVMPSSRLSSFSIFFFWFLELPLFWNWRYPSHPEILPPILLQGYYFVWLPPSNL